LNKLFEKEEKKELGSLFLAENKIVNKKIKQRII
jgi:dsDNA-binding SOS-regulon protein